MNYQNVFNQVTSHLLTQLQKSFIPNIGFRYCTNNLRDPIGHLLAEYYTEDLEVYQLQSKEMINILLQANILTVEDVNNIKPCIRFLTILQNIHDRKSIDDWYECLKNVAYYYKLNFNH